MPNSDSLLTAVQVATMMQVHPETVRRWTREGQLDAVVFPSGRKRYRASDVDALLSTTRATGAA